MRTGNAFTLLHDEERSLFKAFENDAKALSLRGETCVCEGDWGCQTDSAAEYQPPFDKRQQQRQWIMMLISILWAFKLFRTYFLSTKKFFRWCGAMKFLFFPHLAWNGSLKISSPDILWFSDIIRRHLFFFPQFYVLLCVTIDFHGAASSLPCMSSIYFIFPFALAVSWIENKATSWSFGNICCYCYLLESLWKLWAKWRPWGKL